MEERCGIEGGWTLVASVFAPDACPNGWNQFTIPNSSVVGCRSTSDDAGCYSALFTTYQTRYNYVCGSVVGVSKGTPDAFSTNRPYPMMSINHPYLDGVSITYGPSNKRRHIWSLGVGYTSEGKYPEGNCPCADYSGSTPPSFVRNHYYCDAGTSGMPQESEYYYNFPLWSNQNCAANNSCCAQGEAPEFLRLISDACHVTDPIEMRICTEQDWADEGIIVTKAVLYVM